MPALTAGGPRGTGGNGYSGGKGRSGQTWLLTTDHGRVVACTAARGCESARTSPFDRRSGVFIVMTDPRG